MVDDTLLNNDKDTTLPKKLQEEGNEVVENSLQKTFYRDISATMPTLLEQLHAKDTQIEQLNKTVNSLIERNTDLQQKILSYEMYGPVPPYSGSYGGHDGGGGGAYRRPSASGDFMGGNTKPVLLIVGLFVFLFLGLKLFDFVEGRANRENKALIDEYKSQRQDYAQMVGEYESKISTLETDKAIKEKQLEIVSFTVDTLSKTIALLSQQLNKEGAKTETINTLTKQLSEKETALKQSRTTLDSLNAVYKAEKIISDKLEEKNKLLETVNNMQQAQSSNKFNFDSNILYLLILVLMAAVIFALFDRRR